jgi:ATP-dependent DNA helicase DinG
MAARRRAASADLAVVNHHLLLADMALGEDGFSRLLPGTEVVIVDEAHRFPETAQAALDVTLSSRQIGDLLRDAQAEAVQAGAIDADLSGAIETLAGRLTGASVPGAGEPVAISAAPQALTDVLQAIAQDLDYLEGALAVRADLTPGLGRCRERAAAASAAAARVVAWREGDDLCWAQGGPDSFAVHLTPLDVAAALRERMEAQPCTWIFASATLAVGDDFSHFARRIGVGPLDTCRIGSPFDYNRCARLLLPSGMPSPEAPQYTEAVVDALAPLLRASRGRAFLLFTSRRALQHAAVLLQGRDHGHRLLIQGSASRSRLLDEFVRSDQAVLLGTATFWEGVDIRGPALVVVAIDRLPFASPGDPFLQARLEQVRREGGDPFRDYQLPHAVLTLRQGVGRLIRGHDDYGVIVICDPRLTGRGYGRVFMASLPPMPLVRDVAEACEFLASHECEP